MGKEKRQYNLLALGIAIGVVYGFATRLVFGQHATLASMNYLFVIPAVLGVIPLLFTDQKKLKSYKNIIFIPWITLTSFFLLMFAFGVEDFICLIILAAPFFVMATVGALVYRFVQINKKKNELKLIALLLLPFLIAPIEEHIQHLPDTFYISDEMIIDAPVDIVWNHIVEVDSISHQEYPSGFFQATGIPRPISAEVDHKIIGGHRIGHFEGGLQFNETITAYQKHRKISFAIEVDPTSVRKKVFDQHVLNGNYFMFVEASYQLEKLAGGQTCLTLSSGYRLTSTVNFYGKFWGDWILSDFQERLLVVIKDRCEE